jgi:hypothetical protein
MGKEEQAALGENRDNSAWMEVERFAEESASEALIPAEMLSVFLRRMSVKPDAWDIALMRSLSNKFRVTPLAMATRLRAAGELSWDGYNRWKEEWNKYIASLPKPKGFALPVDKALGRSGRPFAQLVLEALDANRITSVEASRYLDLKFDHFEKLRNELHTGPLQRTEGFNNGE